MASSNPTLIVRVAATIAELRANLAEGRSTIETTTASMQRMAASFSGDKIVQHANNVMAALVKVGGLATLTTQEQARINRVLEEALEKYDALGRQAPVGMREVAEATREASRTTDTLRGSLGRFDSVLAQLGVNLGSEIRAIDEIAASAGKSATEIGLLSTAGLALGAGFAGWKVGRMVADFFDLDQKIGNATAKMLGWGDVAGQTAAAKQDTINAAIRRGADANITYAEAIAFNTKAVKEQLDALGQQAKVQQQHAAELKKIADEEARWAVIMGELRTAGIGWQATLAELDGNVVAAIKFYLEAGVSQSTLATAYGVTAAQIRAVTEAMKDDVAWLGFREAATKRQKEIIELTTKATNDRVLADFKAKEAADAANEAFLKGALDDALAQDKLNGILGEMPPTIAKGAAAFQGATREAGVFMQQLTMLVTDPKTAGFFGSGAQGAVAATLFGGGRLTPEMAAAMAAGQFINTAGVGSVQRRQGGGPVSPGVPYVVGERRAEIFVPDRAGTILPGGGGGTVINLAVHINGSLLSDEHKIARAFGDAAINLLRSQGLRLPSGA